MLKGFSRHHGAAWRRKTAWLTVWIVAGSAVFLACGRILWLAHTTHTVITPLRRYRRIVGLDESPGFFWACVVVYALVFLCAPAALASWASDLAGQFRPLGSDARKQRVGPS
ncbi:hypothetical protein [Caulobacter hibisci]|uniref:Uncharacterized protein n=1 Tax=Caulobacter hibisci TaxID=2035993 RepID=A0ABS0T6A2_9CAUL|nr:hypothetical protein [Caulobacter hibisci]MBI1686428.1 hypothetical protein [Caulobacter hibisci]